MTDAPFSSHALVLGALPSPGEVEYPLAELESVIVPIEATRLEAAPDGAALRDAMLTAFASFMELDVANGQATPDTIKGYYEVVRGWLAWCRSQNLHPGEIAPLDVKKYRAQMMQDGKAIATRGTYLSIIRRFYEAAVEHGVLDKNPAKSVRGGSDQTPREEKIRALTEGSLRALLGAIQGDTLRARRDRAIVGLMALHGLRRIEVHRLDHDSLREDDEGALLMVLGKRGRVRRVYLREDTFHAWREYEAAKLAAGYGASGAFFLVHAPHCRGDRLSRRSLNDVVDKYLGVSFLKREGVSCHALRHTMGTLSVAGGAKVEHVQSAMGHESLDTTMIYVKAVERRKNNPATFIVPSLYEREE